MQLPMPVIPGPDVSPNPFRGLVSVVLASYNCAATLPRSIESLLAQTYPNIEIVVADDASTDNTAEVVARFASVKYVRRDKNGGVAAARNTGAAASTGEIIVFGESDGYYDADYIEKIIRYLHMPGIAGAINLGRRVWSDKRNALVRMQNDQFEAICDLVEQGRRGTGAWAFHRAAFDSVGGYDLGCRIGSDLDLVFRMQKTGLKTTIGARSNLYHKDPDNLRAWWKRSHRGGVNSALYRERWHGMAGASKKALYLAKYAAMALWPVYLLLAICWHPLWLAPFFAVPAYLLTEDAMTRLGWWKGVRRGDVALALATPVLLYIRRLAIGYGRIQGFAKG